MTNEIIDGKEILCALKYIYMLQEPINCTFLRSSFNDHYLITSNGKKQVLRLYKKGKSYIQDINDIRFELDFIEFLYNNSIPVAPPLRGVNNEFLNSLLYKGDVRYIALFDYAQGKQLDNINVSDAKHFGKVVAELHKCANKFLSKYSRFKVDPTYLIEEPLKSVEKYIQKFGLTEISHSYQFTSKLLSYFSQLPLENGAFGLIHGDLNPSNVHYSEENGFTIFDFDHCPYGWRIHDLAVTRLCFSDNVYYALLEGYQSIKPLSQIEEKSIAIYSDVLLLRKSKDIIDVLEAEGGSEEKIKEVTVRTIDTINMLMERPFT